MRLDPGVVMTVFTNDRLRECSTRRRNDYMTWSDVESDICDEMLRGAQYKTGGCFGCKEEDNVVMFGKVRRGRQKEEDHSELSFTLYPFFFPFFEIHYHFLYFSCIFNHSLQMRSLVIGLCWLLSKRILLIFLGGEGLICIKNAEIVSAMVIIIISLLPSECLNCVNHLEVFGLVN